MVIFRHGKFLFPSFCPPAEPEGVQKVSGAVFCTQRTEPEGVQKVSGAVFCTYLQIVAHKGQKLRKILYLGMSAEFSVWHCEMIQEGLPDFRFGTGDMCLTAYFPCCGAEMITNRNAKKKKEII